MAKISIIVPVYNSKPFLEQCTDSLLAQTFSDFEAWLVDDGSTDGSSELCDRLGRKDPRIRVMHTANHGVTHARKVGVEQASGEWITFADSDDTLPADALERLYRETTHNTDIIVGFPRKSASWKPAWLSPEKYRRLMIEGRHNISIPCGKLFRKTLFDKDTFHIPREIVMGEDMLMNLRLTFASPHPVRMVRGKGVYNYIQHSTSVTHRFRLTADYEHRFHQERLEAIPQSEHSAYMPVMIHRRLRMLRRLLKRAVKEGTVQALQDSPFVKELACDIRRHRYPFIRYPYPSLWRLLAK